MNILLEEVVMVILGGGIGSVARLLLSRGVQQLFPYEGLPWGIIACNILGCFLIGILLALFEAKLLVSPVWRAGMVIGVLGGFTTFSSFSMDTFHLLQTGSIMLAFSNIAISLFGCLFATAMGFWMVSVML